jgi:GIGANTEA
LACGEILRVLTLYNRPIFKVERQNSEAECSRTSDEATSSDSSENKSNYSPGNEFDRKPLRPLTPWITDILLAAPLGIRSDYFRW